MLAVIWEMSTGESVRYSVRGVSYTSISSTYCNHPIYLWFTVRSRVYKIMFNAQGHLDDKLDTLATTRKKKKNSIVSHGVHENHMLLFSTP